MWHDESYTGQNESSGKFSNKNRTRERGRKDIYKLFRIPFVWMFAVPEILAQAVNVASK